jgi:hypothetical protein
MSVNFYQTTWRNNPEDCHIKLNIVGSPNCYTVVHKIDFITFIITITSDFFFNVRKQQFKCCGSRMKINTYKCII